MNKRQNITWLCIGLLLLIRLPLETGLPLVMDELPTWLTPTLDIGAFLIVAFLIWWERHDLAAFHLDSLAVWLLVLAKPLQTIILKVWGFLAPLALLQPLSWALFAIPLALLAALTLSRRLPGLPSARSLAWLIAGALLGLLANILVTLDRPASTRMMNFKKLFP